MRRDKRAATFGDAYWRRPHPDVNPFQADLYLIDWALVGKAVKPVIDTFTATRPEVHETLLEAFYRLYTTQQVVVDGVVVARRAGQSDFVLWPDAQRVTAEDYDDPDWTLGRIDTAVSGWEGDRCES